MRGQEKVKRSNRKHHAEQERYASSSTLEEEKDFGERTGILFS